MPIYEFECEECGEIKEGLYKMADAPDKILVLCPAVRQPRFYRRIMSGSNFHLKGRGWAKDDYGDPLRGDELSNVTGENFRKEYRKQLADPDHPRKVGDILKKVRKGDDLSDVA